MSYKDKYVMRSEMYGNGLREIKINNSKRKLESVFHDSPSYYRVLMSTPLIPLAEAYEVDSQIVDNSEVRDEKKLVTYYDTDLVAGNLFNWQEKYWLMIHQDTLSEIYKRGIIRRCYTTIRWQGEDGEIDEAWFAHKTDVSPNFGVDDRNKTITMPDERRQILVQSNKDTRLFKKEDRFIFDGRAWKVIMIDTTGDGIINMVLEESKLNPATDNEELRVANYNPNTYSVQFNNENNTSININQTLQLDIVAFKNSTQVSIDEITLSSTNESIGIVDNTGLFTPTGIGEVTILAEYMGKIVSVDIIVRDILINNYTIDIIGSDTINSNQSKTYQIVFKNNGQVVDESFDVSLFADDGISETKIAKITSRIDNNITLLADKSLLGYVQLYIVSLNGLIYNSKRIRIKTFI